MPTFNLVINQDRLYVWSCREGDRKAENFEGKPYFSYSSNRVKEGVDNLERILMDNNNLVNIDEIKFEVVFSRNQSLNTAFENALSGKIAGYSNLDEIIMKIMRRLESNRALYIAEFGINYDGNCYKLHKGQLKVEDFSLLAYTLTDDYIMREL